MRNSLIRCAAAAALALSLGGCLGGRSPQPEFYLLTARAPLQKTLLPVSIGVGPVRVAPFLARPAIATHAGGGRLELADTRRWGEPLEQGIQRVTLENLSRLTHAQLRNFPWRQSAIPDYAVRLDVLDLDRRDGQALLQVSWQLENLHTHKLMQARSEQLTVAVADADYGALADAYSELFAQLAQHIATALQTQG